MADFLATAGFDTVPLIEDSDAIQGRVTGDTVANGSLENANKQSQALLNNIEALKIGAVRGPRNCILSGSVDAFGWPTFAVFLGGELTVGPVLLSFANGYSDFGSTDVVGTLAATVIDYSVLADGMYLLFAERSSGGTISLQNLFSDTVATVKYHVGEVPPAFLAATQYWYDSSRDQMYKEVGGAWVATMAVFLGGVAIDNTFMTYDLVQRPYGRGAAYKDILIGSIQPFTPGQPMQYGWILCDGTNYLRSLYIELYNAITGTYGSSGRYFDVPDFTGMNLGTGASLMPVDYYIKAF